MPEFGQKGRTVNPLASAYVGSNPTSPTNYTAGIFTTNSERGTVSTDSKGSTRKGKRHEFRSILIDTTTSEIIISGSHFVRSYGVKDHDCKHSLA